jgi:hypothetical protein
LRLLNVDFSRFLVSQLVANRSMENARKEMKTYVPSNSKSESIIAVAGTELRNGTWERKPSGHLTQALHHGEDRDTSEAITEQDGKRARLGESTTDTQEQTRSDRATKSNELNVSRFQAVGEPLSVLQICSFAHSPRFVDLPSSHITVFLCRLDISVNVSSLSHAPLLAFDSRSGIDICGVSMAIVILSGLVDVVSVLLHGC